MRKFLALVLFLIPSLAAAQGFRVTSQVIQQGTVGTSTNAVVLPANPIIAFCNFPANAVPCTNKATTYTNATLATPCATSTQIVLDATTSCVASPDAQNNWGVWVALGQYAYTITLAGGVNLGPYFVSAPIMNSPAWIVGNCLQEGVNGPVTTSGPCGVSAGTVTATGSPVAGQGAFMSGAASITSSANWLYSASSGHSVVQGANNTDAFGMQRFTDVAPTGNFLRFQNAALNANLFLLDVTGKIGIENALAPVGTGALVRSVSPAFSGTAIGTANFLPVTLFNSGTGAGSSTFWRGDGTWAAPPVTIIASGTSALGTLPITGGTCAAVVTTTATGTSTTDAIIWSFNSDPNGVAGYTPAAGAGSFNVWAFPTANNVNFRVCSAAGVTPGAMTVNWRVVR